MENDPFIDDFPIKTSIYEGFSMAMLNTQMVSPNDDIPISTPARGGSPSTPENHFLIPTLHGREWRTVVQLMKLVREVELQEQVSKHSWMEDGLWWNETTVRLGAFNTTPG